MKSIYWLIFCLFSSLVALAQGPPGIDLLNRVQPNRILLRWIPSTPEAWQAANQAGYTVTRTTLTSAGATPSPTKTVTVNGIKATDRFSWQPYLNADSLQYATIYYLTINDAASFQRPPASVTDSLDGRATVTPQFKLDERYVYVTMAANTRFAAAVKAGLGYIDTDAKPGETYRYTVSTGATVVENGVTQSIASASVVLGLSNYAPLPKPALVQPIQQKKRQITLAWDGEIQRPIYGSYDIERATNLTGTFSRLNEEPYVQLADSSQYLYYADSLPNKTRIYRYRIIGRSYFDEAQTSDPVAVTIVQELQSLPGINAVQRNNGAYTINWRYPADGLNTRLDTVVSQFVVSVSTQDTTGYRRAGTPTTYAALTTSLPAALVASLVDTTKSHYFRVSAIGVSGDTLHSLPYMIVPTDVLPPAAPQGVLVSDLSASLTNTNQHLIRVEWRPNTETDLLGYRVFRQIGNEIEKIEVSGGIRPQLFLVDTLSRNVGLPQVTYFVWAFDQSYHQSLQAGVGRFRQPDLTAPMPPRLTGYSAAYPGVILQWELSPSGRMESIRHELLRKELNGTGNWQIVWSGAAGDTTRQYTDPNVVSGNTYVYSMVARDEANNVSCYQRSPATPADCYQLLVVKPPTAAQTTSITSFTAQYDTLTNQVQLGWQSSQSGIQTYEIYKARTTFKPTAWQTFDGATYAASDAAIDSGLTYTYQLRAVFANGTNSPWLPATVTIRRERNPVANQPPRPGPSLPAQYAVVGAPFSYTLSNTAFTDPDGQLVSILFTGRMPVGLVAQGRELVGVPGQPGSYTVNVVATDDRNGIAQSPLVIIVEPALSAPAVYGTGTVCAGQSTSLSAANCSGNIRWSTGATGIQLVVTPTQTTTYTASCQTARQTSGQSIPFVVTVIAPLSAPVLTNQAICLDGSATLAPANCAGIIKWSVGYAAPQLTVSPVVTTAYSATCVVAGCTSPAASATVTVKTPPNLAVTGNLFLCSGQTTTLTAQAPGATAYRWSNGLTTATLTATVSGVYAVTVTGENGCSRIDSAEVRQQPAFAAIIIGPTTLCAGQSTVLTASGGSNYRWNTGAATASITARNAGVYSVTVSAGSGCAAMATTTLTTRILVAPTIATSAGRIMSGQSVTLTAAGCAQEVTWSTGATGNQVVVSPVASSTYAAICLSGDCSSDPSNVLTVNVTPAPFAITGVTMVSCQTLSAGQRSIQITPRYVGLNGQAIEFSVVNELGATTAAGPYTLNLYTDNSNLTLQAVQGGATSRFIYNWLSVCNGTASTQFAITGVTMVSCQTLSAGERSIQITPRYMGLSGQPVSFSIVNELNPTTLPGPYTLRLYTDRSSLTLSAIQGGVNSSFDYNWLAQCNALVPTNQAPTVAAMIANQVATVGQAFSLAVPASTFADDAGPANLTVVVSGLPVGLSYNATTRVISGTATTLGVSVVTATATDGGGLSVSTAFSLTVGTASTQFAITGVTMVSCQTISAGQRSIQITPRYMGLNGQPVSFSIVNEFNPTTLPGPYTLRLYTDNPTLTLQAVQSGVISSFRYNWLALCP